MNLDAKLRERLLLARAVAGDRLMLADATLLAALDGTRPLSPGELAALNGSPATLRRFRHLALARRRGGWQSSTGMLRAASSGDVPALTTDDGLWTLHFVAQDGGWRVVLALDAAAPVAAGLLRERTLLRVTDGAGTTLLQGRLDADGECEHAWPFAAAPADHLQRHGATFAVTALAAP
ncbi:hypothetical protein [Pseudoduganella umbonata]|uniref:Uncharacterized protein n=1 Tax=Pseudoduganella umbonata TaxID=864828 RepID=A0A4P8HM55_9BURK|nr:hypothetical protein [Pseudoduganella umbonata]MBB3219413.1 hypothetical protein [Pseudoduganella umbonata]QCP09504.1 hypothetical protein FCL38_03015 [Pseudoduganella umbonata]